MKHQDNENKTNKNNRDEVWIAMLYMVGRFEISRSSEILKVFFDYSTASDYIEKRAEHLRSAKNYKNQDYLIGDKSISGTIEGIFYEYALIRRKVCYKKELPEHVTIKEEFFTDETLKKIMKFDSDVFYEDYHLTEEWYKARYKPHHSMFVAYYKKYIIGYVCAVPIEEKLYDTIVSGILTDDINVNPNLFVKDSKFIYLPSVVIAEQFRNKGIGSRLMEKVISKYKNKFLCCITISGGGYNLADKYMNKACSAGSDHDVFIRAT